ncbi:MAG: hypothetical protein ACJA0M_000649 [Chitinophagales bacterium]|jgi:hypothetical protein
MPAKNNMGYTKRYLLGTSTFRWPGRKTVTIKQSVIMCVGYTSAVSPYDEVTLWYLTTVVPAIAKI